MLAYYRLLTMVGFSLLGKSKNGRQNLINLLKRVGKSIKLPYIAKSNKNRVWAKLKKRLDKPKGIRR